MRFVSFSKRSTSIRAGLLVRGNRVLDISRAYAKLTSDKRNIRADTGGIIEALQGLSASTLEIIKAGGDVLQHCMKLETMALEGNMEDCLFAIGEARLVSPIPVPPVILHFASSEAHEKALWGGKLPETWYQHPHFHYDNPYSLYGTGARISFPEGEEAPDFEMEFAVVLGEETSNAGLKAAEAAIFGYTIVNHWTARSMERRSRGVGLGPGKAKSFATSCGPWIVTKDEISDAFELRMTARVNGETLGTVKSGDLRYTIAEMISWASEGSILPAGTIICTGGMVSGAARPEPRHLEAEDEVELDVQGIGTLKNTVAKLAIPRVYAMRKDVPDAG